MLGLSLCWDDNWPRLYDPTTNTYLETWQAGTDGAGGRSRWHGRRRKRRSPSSRAERLAERAARQAAENRTAVERAAREVAEKPYCC